MNWVLFTALFFVTWWLALFVVLPFGVRTQDEDHDVTLGTVSSAPARFCSSRMIWQTLSSTRLPSGSHEKLPCPCWRIMPARSISRCETI
ncbi:MAG: DUF1467 family protein, partial [Alphaproteobacteria bacterium]|nr:DUF1467 family protein [Alphaproteobacteria bacterium]